MALDPENNNADEAKLYTRVHANVVAEVVKNFLTPNGLDDLILQQHKFAFTDITGMKSYDGPTMLKVLLKEIDPTSPVNTELHRQDIEGAKLQYHKGNVAGVGSSLMNLIHHSPSVSLEIFQRGAHTSFGTALADGNTIPAQPWM